MHTFQRGDGRAATVGIRDLLGNGGVQYFYGDGIANRVGPIANGVAITSACRYSGASSLSERNG